MAFTVSFIKSCFLEQRDNVTISFVNKSAGTHICVVMLNVQIQRKINNNVFVGPNIVLYYK